MANEYDHFQFDPGSIGSDWKGGAAARQLKAPGAKISHFEAMKYGTVRSDDYTRVVFDNAHFENPQRVLGVGFGVDRGWYNHNPFVWLSTVKRVLDDKMHRMMMGSIGVVADDVSDRDEVDASGMQSYKNYPSEGWRSFGGKYDFEKAYQG